jgi:hypothetical protein
LDRCRWHLLVTALAPRRVPQWRWRRVGQWSTVALCSLLDGGAFQLYKATAGWGALSVSNVIDHKTVLHDNGKVTDNRKDTPF